LIALAPFVALTVGGAVLGSAVKNMDKFGEEIQPGAGGTGLSPGAQSLSPTFSGYTEQPDAFPLVDTQKMDGYRVKVRGRVASQESISAIGSLFDEFNVSDIRQGTSREAVERLMNRSSR